MVELPDRGQTIDETMPAIRFLSFLFWGSWLAYAWLIFHLSSGATPQMAVPFPDKLLHLTCYTIFVLLLLNALSGGLHRKLKAPAYIGALLVTLLFGISDEFHQSLVPQRHASIFDLAADAAGGLLGIAIFLIIIRIRQPQS